MLLILQGLLRVTGFHLPLGIISLSAAYESCTWLDLAGTAARITACLPTMSAAFPTQRRLKVHG